MTLPDLHPALSRALASRGYDELTPVQLAVLEADAAGRDLLVSAQTGSGKTVAYGLAFASDLLGEAETLPAAGEPLALVIAPTRELALQVQRELQWLYAEAGARVVSCVGGMDPRREQRALAAGAHIVVGTPGRLRDHLERGNLQIGGLKAAVLDEADEMLDLGFREELEAILDAAAPERRTLLFSATLPRPIVALASRYQKDALRISVAAGEQGHADIEYQAIAIAPNDVEHATVNLLRFYEAGAAIVFCSTRESVRKLHANLVERGFAAVALSGELTQGERSHALQALRDRRARVCVATDVAARGIDIPDLELVIHAELPVGAEALQHRSGRTGRAGRKGVSVILVPYPRRRRAESLFRFAKVQVTWGTPPSADEIRERDQARFVEALKPSGEPAAEEDLALARTLLAEIEAEQLVASLVRDRRAQLPAPEDLVDAEPEPQTRQPRAGFEDSAWFRIPLGRHRNADPRWMLPMICRRGHVTKREIGAIRIYERESQFEIVRSAADRFAEAIAHSEDDDAPIEAMPNGPEAVAPRERRPMRDRPQRERGPREERAPREDRAPREAREEREPQGEYVPREEGDRSSWSPRTGMEGASDRGERSERPERPHRPRPAGKPRPQGDKPWAAKAYGERPARREGDERPAGGKSWGPKPYGERPARGEGDERPSGGKPWGAKPYGERPARGEGEGRPAGGKPRPYAAKPWGAKPKPEGAGFAEGDRRPAKKAWGGKDAKPWAPRPEGARPDRDASRPDKPKRTGSGGKPKAKPNGKPRF